MNILMVLQQSVYNNKGQWMSLDSNIMMMRGILNQLIKLRPHWRFYVLIAPISDFANITSYTELIDHPNVEFMPYHFPVDAFLNRQHFNVDSFGAVFEELEARGIYADVVWNNLTEISRNIKTYLHYTKRSAKLVTCCYWLDTPEISSPKVDQRISYDWRQVDGFECSDLAVFTCESTKVAFVANASKKFSSTVVNNIMAKSVVWDFGFSSAELDTEERHSPRLLPSDGKQSILFLNRMSGINYTHHLEFISAIQKLARERDDFRVVVANPSQKIDWGWLKQNIPNLYVIGERPLTRQEYIQLLWEGCISVHLYLDEMYGGCAHRESLYCGNIIVAPKVHEYRRIHGESYPFYVRSDFSNLADIMFMALGVPAMDTIPDYQNMIARNLGSAFEIVGPEVATALEGICYAIE